MKKQRGGGGGREVKRDEHVTHQTLYSIRPDGLHSNCNIHHLGSNKFPMSGPFHSCQLNQNIYVPDRTSTCTENSKTVYNPQKFIFELEAI